MARWKRACIRHENCIWALGLVLVLFLPLVFCFDLYYDLNDDVLIKDILSGVYTGSPEGRTMQLLYPLGLVLSLLYRVLSVPVFGVFLALCQFGSIFVIAQRSAALCQDRRMKALVLAAEGSFFGAAFGMHLIYLQYTVTAGMLASAALFWVLTAETKTEGAGFFYRLKAYLPALFLYWLAFCLRTEMAFLLLPLAGVAGLCRWAQEKQFFAKENLLLYPGIFGVLLLGMVLCVGADRLAYTGQDWKEFGQFFAERTELYDYQLDFVTDYEANEEAYRQAGVSRARQQLLENYNFGADDSIDADLLAALKEEAKDRQTAGGLFRKTMGEGLWLLRCQHWLSAADLPFNAVWLLCAFCGLALGVCSKRRYLLWQVPLGIATGGSLWLFLLLRDRPLERVTHPLYLGMAALFAGLLLRELGRSVNRKRANTGAVLVSLSVLLFCGAGLPDTWTGAGKEQARREEVNADNEAVMAYCSAHPGQLFLADVYSTVAFSEKITVDRDKPFNYDLLGGWLVKSPLTAEKLSAFGFAAMGEALQPGEQVQLIIEKDGDMQWLRDFLAEQQTEAVVLKTGSIADCADLYQILPGQAEQTLEKEKKEIGGSSDGKN